MHRAYLIAVLLALPASAAAANRTRGPAPVTVYLRTDGGTLSVGWDDSTSDVSSLASRSDDGEVTVPAWRGGDRRWRRITACVRERFAEFAIDVVETRPARGDYIMVMVGGRSSLLGYGAHVSGVSPYTGEVVPRAVSFVFSDTLRNDVEGTCVSILHEVGHTLGLDHAYLCEDPMSYLYGCGAKRFQDAEAYCGEEEPRSCGNGADTQNSYQHLARAVGLRTPNRDADAGADAGEQGQGQTLDPYADPELAPTIELSNGTLTSDHVLTLTARASAPDGVADVVLLWATDDGSYAWACTAIPDDVPARCTRSGDTFTFRLRVGTGRRGVAAVAVDRAGGHTSTDPRWIWLDQD